MLEDYVACKAGSVAYLTDLNMHLGRTCLQKDLKIKELETEQAKLLSQMKQMQENLVQIERNFISKQEQSEDIVKISRTEFENLKTNAASSRMELRDKTEQLDDIKSRLRCLFSHTRTLISFVKQFEDRKKKGDLDSESSVSEEEGMSKKRNYGAKMSLREAVQGVYQWHKPGKPLNFDQQGRRKKPLVELLDSKKNPTDWTNQPLEQITSVGQGFNQLLKDKRTSLGKRETIASSPGFEDLQHQDAPGQKPPARVPFGPTESATLSSAQDGFGSEKKLDHDAAKSPNEKYWDTLSQQYHTPAIQIIQRQFPPRPDRQPTPQIPTHPPGVPSDAVRQHQQTQEPVVPQTHYQQQQQPVQPQPIVQNQPQPQISAGAPADLPSTRYPSAPPTTPLLSPVQSMVLPTDAPLPPPEAWPGLVKIAPRPVPALIPQASVVASTVPQPLPPGALANAPSLTPSTLPGVLPTPSKPSSAGPAQPSLPPTAQASLPPLPPLSPLPTTPATTTGTGPQSAAHFMQSHLYPADAPSNPNKGCQLH